MLYYIWTDEGGCTDLSDRTEEPPPKPFIVNVAEVVGGVLPLKGSGLIYLCTDPLLGVFNNPLCPGIIPPLRMFEVEPLGEVSVNPWGGLLWRTKEDLRVIREVPCPDLNDAQRTAIAIRSVTEVTHRMAVWCEWAEKWLSKRDRSREGLMKAGIAARAAWEAVRAVDDIRYAAATVQTVTRMAQGKDRDSVRERICKLCYEVYGE